MNPLKIVIPGPLPGLNEYVKANRANPHTGSRMSRAAHEICKTGMIKYNGRHIKRGWFIFSWYEKNQRRDKDNIAFAKKFILDALQEMKILKNDGWTEVAGFEDRFYVDKHNPRVEVEIYEEGNEDDEAEQKGTKD